jgi:hypothetical protein
MIKGNVSPNQAITGEINTSANITGQVNSTQNITGETNNSVLGDYKTLSNKPSINGVELNGNKTTKELGIEAGGSDVGILTEFDIEYTYEDNQVYNANAIHQLLELFVYEITMIQEEVASYSERISALEEKVGG